MPTYATRLDDETTAPDWVCGSEDVPWDANDDATSWSRRVERGPYAACVPADIAALTPDLNSHVLAEAAEAAVEMARFDAEVAGRFDGAVVDLLLLAEAVASSRIESIRAETSEVARALLGERTDPASGLVAANAHATRRATGLGSEFGVGDLVAVHETLLGQHAPHQVGQFRSRPVWIGTRGSTPHTASYVAPVPERVPDLMVDLTRFAVRTDIAPFVQAAVAHAQFETVHPFPDGNGRSGRSIFHGMLRSAKVTQKAIAPISAGLLPGVEDYYEALAAYRRGDLNRIVSVLSSATFLTVSSARFLVNDLTEAMEGWNEQIAARRDAVVWRALPLLVAQPVISIKWLAASTDVSLPAAQRAIEQMEEAEVISPVGSKRRSRTWVADDVVAALGDFAVRSGRRFSGAYAV